MEGGVEPAGGEELGVRALLDHAAVVEHEDQVGVADGGEPVRDHERRTPLEGRVERLLDRGLGLAVEVGGRLVEDDDRGCLEQQPGDREALPLAAAEPVARGRRRPCRGRRAGTRTSVAICAASRAAQTSASTAPGRA